ncbi:allophanate hydrolase [Methylobacterium mesophilicum SR1.6/6]|uniref:Allophanate hydrolase n=1 Tax=Methylobacterium mesophilicum SR1.6/6 TaxID=908290 RepID=A0A6B9FPK6_9HYPH|nr:allophanate hydrolase [Methylobacterium mesophilicum]QGY03154.1 allophanate hydrolase [Methylobacterium mesophilicum SR1.6/6]
MPPFPTIPLLHAAYADGLDPRAVVAAAYRRIAEVDDPGIFLALVPEADAQAAAAALPPFDPVSMPLWGVPFAVKDNIDVAGLPNTAACPDFAYSPTETAPAVARLLAAGAILIGKTNLDQFATGLVGLRTPYPAPRNAIDPAFVPGGSSSGSAVAVAHGIVSFALGTDTAGSGRVPAALNNIVGLKPSLGAVSSRGMLPACRTLDTLSVFAGTVADADAAFRVMLGPDNTDPWSRALPVPPAPAGLPPGLRLGLPDAASRRFGGDGLSEAAFAAAAADLEAITGAGVPVDLDPMFAVAALLYDGPWVAERYAAVRPVMETRPGILHPTTRAVIAAAERYSAADAFAGLYRLAELRRHADAIWDRIDVLAVPTYPRPRTCASVAADPIGPNSELGTYTNFVNLLDWCALAVPGRSRTDSFPSGVTLLAPRGCDGLLAALGARLHAASAGRIGASAAPVPTAKSGPASARPGEIELAVVGAHLSGLPLNGELVACGARYLRAGVTRPDYRLYALPGGPPHRPGLLRVAAGEGSGIETEVWALPPSAFGTFVAGIPDPLSIGTVRLNDGTTPKGFLVEAAGIAGAADITRFGGWRRYVTGCAAA